MADMDLLTMSRGQFIERFGTLYEHSPWVAERTYDQGIEPGLTDWRALHQIFCEVFLLATPEEQLAVIRHHPDLAGRAARSGSLTADSTEEQASAGIDQLSDEEYDQFTELNTRYRARFEFPFIMAVKGSNKNAILDGFKERLNNSYDQEFSRALSEINKIAAFRLEALFTEEETE